VNRAEHLTALEGATVADVMEQLAAAASPVEVEEATFVALLALGWEAIRTDAGDGRTLLRHITAARGRVGLVDSETTRKAQAREAETRLLNDRAMRRASA
jgi:hypothetical protein